MTEAESRAMQACAKLADGKISLPRQDQRWIYIFNLLFEGYAAACEDKRTQIEWLMNLLEHYAQDVHREIVTGRLKMEHTDF